MSPVLLRPLPNRPFGSACALCNCAPGQDCHPQTGVCEWKCEHPTFGERCGLCAKGYFDVSVATPDVDGGAGAGAGPPAYNTSVAPATASTTTTTTAGPAMCSPCHENCGPGGCTGPQTTLDSLGCSDCTGLRNATHCVEDCPANTYLAADPSSRATYICMHCDAQCAGGCFRAGPTKDACRGQCKTASFYGVCVPICPVKTYTLDDDDDDTTAITCQSCHEECRAGCDGPTKYDCDSAGCKNVVDDDGCEPRCRIGDYPFHEPLTLASTTPNPALELATARTKRIICRHCHLLCDSTIGCVGGEPLCVFS